VNGSVARIVCVLLVVAGASAPVAALDSSAGVARTYFVYGLARAFVDYSERSVIDLHGLGHPDRPERPMRRCYQLRRPSTFLTVIFDAQDPGRPVTGVLVTSEPNCTASAQSEAEVREVELDGCGQVRLGDSSEKLHDLGAELRPAWASRYLWPNPAAEVSQYDYRCGPEQERRVKASAFVRAGRVIGVAMWVPDQRHGASTA